MTRSKLRTTKAHRITLTTLTLLELITELHRASSELNLLVLLTMGAIL